jgi:ribosomal protein L37AE/L43A
MVVAGKAEEPRCPRCTYPLRERGTLIDPFWECASCGFYAGRSLTSGG